MELILKNLTKTLRSLFLNKINNITHKKFVLNSQKKLITKLFPYLICRTYRIIV